MAAGFAPKTQDDYLDLIYDTLPHSYTRVDELYRETYPQEYQRNIGLVYLYINRDTCLSCPLYNLLNNLSETNRNVYGYLYSYNPVSSEYGFPTLVHHGGELGSLFGAGTAGKKGVDTVSKTIGPKLMEMWANFAKTGNPSTNDLTWYPYDKYSKYYADIGRDN